MKVRYIERHEAESLAYGRADHAVTATEGTSGETIAFAGELPDGKIVLIEVGLGELTRAVAEKALATA